MARSAAECALLLAAMAAADSNDPASLAPPEPPGRYPTRAARGRRTIRRVRR